MAIDGLTQLADRLRADYPDASVWLSIYGSDGAMLSISLAGTLYVLEYYSQHGYGISKVGPDEGWLRGSDEAFSHLEQAADALLERLNRHRPTERACPTDNPPC